MRILESGTAEGIEFLPSPNCDDRPVAATVDLVVVHSISLPPGHFGGGAITDLFMNRLDPTAHPYFAGISRLRVSSHFLIRRDGQLVQYVPCHLRAWHAGVSGWHGRNACNDFSVGIELEGAEDSAFENAQYGALEALTRALLRVYPVRGVVGHSDIAPGRKTDPGPHFDWGRYSAAIGARVDPGGRLEVGAYGH
jgi:AmpD protein